MVRYGFLVLVATIPLLAVPTLARYAALAESLIHLPLMERGHLASNENRNFLARAGRPDLRARVASRPAGEGGRSTVADVWRWAFTASHRLSPRAHIYLNLPTPLLYFYSTFFWFPRRVEVNPSPALLSDASSLRERSVRFGVQDRLRLRQLGYTHLVDRSDRGLTIVDLARGAGEP